MLRYLVILTSKNFVGSTPRELNMSVPLFDFDVILRPFSPNHLQYKNTHFYTSSSSKTSKMKHHVKSLKNEAVFEKHIIVVLS